MGVSKPILENVIFCHQEDSNWPLGDPATLKKKFDEIFAATRYTKALEAIKKERKEQAQLIKENKLKLEHLQTHKENAHKVLVYIFDTLSLFIDRSEKIWKRVKGKLNKQTKSYSI